VRLRWLLLLLLTALSFKTALNAGEEPNQLEKPIVLVVPSYNNKEWYEKNLFSMLQQKYSNFRIIYLNDCSKDGTGDLVESYLKQTGIAYRVVSFDEKQASTISASVQDFYELVNEKEVFFTLVNNRSRSGALANLYRAIHSCDDEEIIVLVDGDDWLFDHEVLKRLNETYASKEIWFTHGTLKEYPWGHVAWCEPFPSSIMDKRTFRQFKCPSHLRTFYAWLFKKIRLEDFLHKGSFFSMAWDMAIMYPLVEMAEERHAFVSMVNYVYNMSNPINDNKVDPQLQNDLDRLIRGKPAYSRLRENEIPNYMK